MNIKYSNVIKLIINNIRYINAEGFCHHEVVDVDKRANDATQADLQQNFGLHFEMTQNCKFAQKAQSGRPSQAGNYSMEGIVNHSI